MKPYIDRGKSYTCPIYAYRFHICNLNHNCPYRKTTQETNAFTEFFFVVFHIMVILSYSSPEVNTKVPNEYEYNKKRSVTYRDTNRVIKKNQGLGR